MKETLKNILHGATLLATVLAMTGFANADPRIDFRDSKFKRHTVQDAIECNPHTVQDCIPDHVFPVVDDEEEEEWAIHTPTDLARFGGSAQGGPHLSLSAWLEPVESATGSGPSFDPVALPAAELPDLGLRHVFVESGADHRGFIAGAQVPGPGALPLIGLGAIALVGRRRRA